MKKLLLGTAIATVLATVSYAQDQAPSYAEFHTADGRFAAAHGMYDLVKNAPCATDQVAIALRTLTEDIQWMDKWLADMNELIDSIKKSDPNNAMMNPLREMQNQAKAQYNRAKFEEEQMQVWLANLYNKPACPTPAASTPPIPGGGQTPQPADPGPVFTPNPPPQTNVPQQPEDPDSPPPGTCRTDVNAIISLVRLDLSSDDAIQRTPAPYWEHVTIGYKCVWRLLYYVRDAEDGYWKSFLTDVPCTKPPPGSDGGVGGQYCPPSNGALNSPSGDATQSQVALPTPADPIATPLPPLWLRSLTTPGASDHLLNGKSDSDGEPALSDPKTTKQPPRDDKTSDQSKASSNGEKSDSRPAGQADKSDARSTANGKHDNTKSAGSSERASVKAEGTAEHATRSVAHEKTDMAQHPTHANETGHMSGMRESGMHKGGMGGTHGGLLGRMGGMHGGGLGGVGGLLLGGLGRL